eukprot:gb/GECG01000979.1/.p1 GENE.gb/GECG01000979.1/~~gb/GECG01000979.1/.p1  ORF type:complete len:152 (+),score=12.54 gb/GECG01000979.1/:1-456(+)
MSTGALRQRISQIFQQSVQQGSNPGAAAAAGQRMVNRKPDCFATVTITLNNTHVCFSRLNGEVISKVSSGMMGHSGPKRASNFGARQAAEKAAGKAKEEGHKTARLRFKGPSRNRVPAIRGIMAADLQISHLEDVTPFPTNGCRARKTRRL